MSLASLPDIYVYHLDKMSFLTRVIRQSIPIASRYGGVSMYSTVTPTPKEDIEKLVSANKVVVFMKGNPDVIIEMRCRILIQNRMLIVLLFLPGTKVWLLKCCSSDHEDARGSL